MTAARSAHGAPSLKGEKIHAALAVYDPSGTYSRHAGVVMASIFANTARSVCVHLLHDSTLTSHNRDKLTETAQRFGQEVSFIDVGDTILGLSRDVDALTGKFSRGTLFRLVLPRTVDADRIIYLDCDIVVHMPIENLWDTSLQGCSIGAVNDGWSNHASPLRRRNLARSASAAFCAMNVTPERYFNAGVLLMDLGRIRREHDLFGQGAEFFRRFHGISGASDQDFLNHIFADDTLLLPEHFNKFTAQCADTPELYGNIWHVNTKPWQSHSGLPADALYWIYFGRSAWENQLIEAMLEMADKNKNGEHVHRHSSDCLKRIVTQMRKNIAAPFKKLMFEIRIKKL